MSIDQLRPSLLCPHVQHSTPLDSFHLLSSIFSKLRRRIHAKATCKSDILRLWAEEQNRTVDTLYLATVSTTRPHRYTLRPSEEPEHLHPSIISLEKKGRPHVDSMPRQEQLQATSPFSCSTAPWSVSRRPHYLMCRRRH